MAFSGHHHCVYQLVDVVQENICGTICLCDLRGSREMVTLALEVVLDLEKSHGLDYIAFYYITSFILLAIFALHGRRPLKFSKGMYKPNVRSVTTASTTITELPDDNSLQKTRFKINK